MTKKTLDEMADELRPEDYPHFLGMTYEEFLEMGPVIDDPEDVHPLDRMGQRCEADANDPSIWDPEDHVREHIKASFLKVVNGTYDADTDDIVVRVLGTIYKRVVFSPTCVETTLDQSPATVFMLEIEAEFWGNSKRVELTWSVFVGDPYDQDSKDNKFEWKDDEVDTDTLIADGKLIYTEKQWPSAQELIDDVINNYKKQVCSVF
jgi:hypothetical protein